MKKKTQKWVLICVGVVLMVFVAGFLIPERKAMPVGSPNDFNHGSFWYWPWTRGTDGSPHLGVDIFGSAGTPVVSQTGGIVIYAKWLNNTAGNAVVVLGPKWRIHHYFHLDGVDAKPLRFVKPDTRIGTIGNTGNASTTPSHVHYGIATPIPYVWRWFDTSAPHKQPPSKYNWMKVFYLDPAEHLPKK